MALYLWWKAQANYFTPPPESHQKICHITLDDYDFFITWGYLYAMATRGTMHQWNSWRAHGGWTASSTWITLHIFTHLQFTSSYLLWNQHFNGLFQKLQGLRGLISFNMCWFLDERAAVFLDTTNCCRCLQHDSQHTHIEILKWLSSWMLYLWHGSQDIYCSNGIVHSIKGVLMPVQIWDPVDPWRLKTSKSFFRQTFYPSIIIFLHL